MQDKLDELELRISKLVDLLGERVEKMRAVELERDDALAKLKQLEEKAENLESVKTELETQIEDNADKERVMRDRLKTIIDRIDRIESDAAAPEAEEASE